MGGIGSKLIQSASSEDLSLDDAAMTSRKTDGSTCNPSMGISTEEVPSLTRNEMKLMFDPRSPTSDFTRTPIAIDVKETEHDRNADDPEVVKLSFDVEDGCVVDKKPSKHNDDEDRILEEPANRHDSLGSSTNCSNKKKAKIPSSLFRSFSGGANRGLKSPPPPPISSPSSDNPDNDNVFENNKPQLETSQSKSGRKPSRSFKSPCRASNKYSLISND